MINSLVITNYLGDSMKIELSSPEKSGFIVQSITGIGPAKATINTIDMASSDGALFNSSRVGTRNVVLNLMFKESKNASIEDIRHKTYEFFHIKREVTIQFNTDSGTRAVTGYVESNEPDVFQQEETAAISVICPNPYFKEGSSTVTKFGTLENNFEFPFSNESLTESVMEIGTVEYKSNRLFVYSGDVETGFVMTIHSIGNASNISIYNMKTAESMKIDTDKLEALTGSSIIKSDDIIISTVDGKKSATLLRDGVTYNILNCINRDAAWFKLRKGDNTFAFTAETGGANLQFTFENDVLYEGI